MFTQCGCDGYFGGSSASGMEFICVSCVHGSILEYVGVCPASTASIGCSSLVYQEHHNNKVSTSDPIASHLLHGDIPGSCFVRDCLSSCGTGCY